MFHGSKKIKLFRSFYVLAIVSGIFFGGIFGLAIGQFIVRDQAKSASFKVNIYTKDGQRDKEAEKLRRQTFAEVKSKGEATTLPIVTVIGMVLCIGVLIVVGRHNLPCAMDQQGIYTHHWFGKKRHLWTDYKEKVRVNVRRGGIVLSSFDKYIFTTGSVSMITKRLTNGKEVLKIMEENIMKKNTTAS